MPALIRTFKMTPYIPNHVISNDGYQPDTPKSFDVVYEDLFLLEIQACGLFESMDLFRDNLTKILAYLVKVFADIIIFCVEDTDFLGCGLSTSAISLNFIGIVCLLLAFSQYVHSLMQSIESSSDLSDTTPPPPLLSSKSWGTYLRISFRWSPCYVYVPCLSFVILTSN